MKIQSHQSLRHCWWVCKNGCSRFENDLSVSTKAERTFTLWPDILRPGIPTRKEGLCLPPPHHRACRGMCMLALFRTAQTRNNPYGYEQESRWLDSGLFIYWSMAQQLKKKKEWTTITHHNMDQSPKFWVLRKKSEYKGAHHVSFFLKEVQEQTKLTGSPRSQKSGCPWRGLCDWRDFRGRWESSIFFRVEYEPE